MDRADIEMDRAELGFSLTPLFRTKSPQGILLVFHHGSICIFNLWNFRVSHQQVPYPYPYHHITIHITMSFFYDQVRRVWVKV